jgi:hypothetical protein
MRKQAVKLCLVGIVGIIGNSGVKLCQVFADSNHYSQKPVIPILWARDFGNLRSLRELQGSSPEMAEFLWRGCQPGLARIGPMCYSPPRSHLADSLFSP